MKMEPTEVSETSTYSIQTPGNYPEEENTLQSQHGESLKARMWNSVYPLRPQYCGVNPLNAELNAICHLLALLGAHHILHVSRVRVNMVIQFLASQTARNLLEQLSDDQFLKDFCPRGYLLVFPMILSQCQRVRHNYSVFPMQFFIVHLLPQHTFLYLWEKAKQISK
jgi:hypothetical protein